ncbi:MAG: alpha/beta hydrolase [Marine Group II euryarchaeote MED-G33]|nr:MAG: alpha/beta hydrolase [Marine Group II euryarchaeote MED-G33]
MSLRSRLISQPLRINKLLARVFPLYPKVVRWTVHPQTWFFAKLTPAFGVKTHRSTFGGVPGVSFVPKKQTQPDTKIVYLHGGGYCIGSSLTTHRIGLRNLAKITGSICHSIDYRLAPENPHPAALDDALSAWLDIAEKNPESTLILSGDSAGGGLSLALMMRLRDEGHKLPDGAVLFSPWTNLTCDSETYQTLAKADPMLSPRMAIGCADFYAPSPSEKNNPYISPIFGDFKDLPRTLILVGGQEILLDDSRIVGEHAKTAGANFEVDIWPNMFHDWWLFGSLIPESKQCLMKVADWIHSRQ